MENIINSVLPPHILNNVVENENNVSTTQPFTTPTNNNNTANTSTIPTNTATNTIIILTNIKDKG